MEMLNPGPTWDLLSQQLHFKKTDLHTKLKLSPKGSHTENSGIHQ